MHKKFKLFTAVFALVFSLFFAISINAQTEEGDELVNKIQEREKQIQELEKEIQQYNKEVENAAKEATTLKSTIKTLDLTKKKITTDINLTENKINKTNLTIQQVNQQIEEAVENIDVNKRAIISAIKNSQNLQNTSLLEVMFSSKDLGELWTELDNTKKVRTEIQIHSNELAKLKEDLGEKQTSLSGQKKSLVNLKTDLSGKKQAVEYTTKEKATLLVQTKNKEESFKELVKTKEQEKALYEKELFEYESQLNYNVSKSGYPAPKPGLMAWPLDNVFVTQRFGKTSGSSRLYASGTHNGADFRASVGTRVKNVLDGTVVGTGNTDQYKGCYSFGKWVMVRHDNGLSTIYAHLSVISTSPGQRLDTGDLIGYSGNTGYSTGPHLHITVYATEGVRIEKYTSSKGCKEATIPLADIKAYLDPFAYLPKL
ncbi:MAG: peptidoglycan DD-metalloendopeptidase family protein [Patescibacteria group bacterium]